MIKTQELLDRRTSAVSVSAALIHPIFTQRAKNAEIWDVDGKRYIDFAAGVAVNNTGHCHPRLIEAMKSQLENFTHTCQHVAPFEGLVHLAERLNTVVPGDFAKKTTFVSTGAEAVENAIKIARYATGRRAVIAFGGAFHGRTLLGMTLCGKTIPYKKGFGPMVPDVYHVPFPSKMEGISLEDTQSAMRHLFKTSIHPSEVAAIIIEPVQGEGGFTPASTDLMQYLRKTCDEFGIQLVADEIQTGFGRTGRMFAMEHFGVAADLTAMAKGLAGGMPLAALTGRSELMDAVPPGGIGGTYGGNPVAIASAHAVLDVIEVDGLCARAEELAIRLRNHLDELQQSTPEISDIRGLGFMMAVEFSDPNDNSPNTAFVVELRNQARELGLILLSCGAHGNVIRFLPPLTIENDVFDEGFKLFEQAIIVARKKLS